MEPADQQRFESLRDTARENHSRLQVIAVQVQRSASGGDQMQTKMLQGQYNMALGLLTDAYAKLRHLQRQYPNDPALQNAIANTEAYFADLREQIPQV